MCLGIPGKIIEKFEESGTKMCSVDFGGVKNKVCLEYVPDAEINDYVIVHVGFALSKLDEEEAKETLSYLNELGMIEREIKESEQ